MRSYSDLIQLYQDLTNNTDSSNQTLGATLINDGIRDCIGRHQNYKFLETTFTETTVASQSDYQLPYDYGTMLAVKTKEGDYFDVLTQVKSRDDWNLLTDVDYESDYITHYYVNNRTISLFPTPATSGNDIVMYYKKRVKDIGTVDYTTGTISVTNGDATVTGSGTTFTAAMVGRYLKVDTDGFWYRIASFTSTTSIELEDEYQGATSAGASYTIGEMSVLPDDFDVAPAYYAAMIYYMTKNTDQEKFSRFEKMYNELKDDIRKTTINSTFAIGSEDFEDILLTDPNDYPRSIT